MALRRVFVIGMGEVGRRLAAALGSAGVEVLAVTRESGWDAAASPEAGARLVCVGETQLAPVIERLAGAPAGSLVCVQNGWIRDELAGVPALTRGLIWFTSKGEFFRVLRPSPFAGPLAGELAALLQRGGIDAVALDDEPFRRAEAEKMGFNCVVGLPLVVSRLSLGEYLAQRREEARAVFDEAVSVTATALGVAHDPGWWPAFLEAAAPLAWVRSSTAKALAYRNGAVVRLAHALGFAAPANERLLAALE